MGMNLLLYDIEKLKNIDEWDSTRYINDRIFVNLLSKIECNHFHPEGTTDYDQEYYMYTRPKDINELREKILQSESIDNKERYYELCNLLEKDKNLYIHKSW